jgi:hypothetical protein
VSPGESSVIEPGSLLVFTANDPRRVDLTQTGEYAPVHVVTDVTGSPAAEILVRK